VYRFNSYRPESFPTYYVENVNLLLCRPQMEIVVTKRRECQGLEVQGLVVQGLVKYTFDYVNFMFENTL
jgi:hypothetical protein